MDQVQFERVHDPTNGLGPVFNAASCAQCHQNNVTGSASQITELRVGQKDANGNFLNPTILINNGAASIGGRSIVDDRANTAERVSGFGRFGPKVPSIAAQHRDFRHRGAFV